MGSQKIYVSEITVSGSGRFPIDMLRYDNCVPVRSEDTFAIERVDFADSEPREVQLRRYSVNPDPPTVGRWKSFLWNVVVVRNKAA